MPALNPGGNELMREVEGGQAVAHASRTTWFWWAGCAATFLAIVICRMEVLAMPPYWDAAIGLWPEAILLVESDFDYRRLLFTEPTFRQGGFATYQISLMPTLLALCMRFLPTVTSVIVLYHLFTMACATAIAAGMFAILRATVDAGTAALCCLACLTTPLLCTQIDMVAMELPMTACAVVASACMLQNRLNWTAAAALLSFLMKPTGLLVTTVLVGLATLRLIVAWRTIPLARPRVDVPGVVSLWLSWGIQFTLVLLVKWRDLVDVSTEEVYNFRAAIYWCPDVLLLFAGVAMLVGCQGIWRLAALRSISGWSARWRRACTLVRGAIFEPPIVLVAGLIALAACAACYNLLFLPRYLVIAVPFVYLTLCVLLVAPSARTKPARMILASIVVINLVNWNGILFPSLERSIERHFGISGASLAREGSLLERSHEYLPDHRANIAAARRLAEECAEQPIFAGLPFNYFLSFPALGYVSEPLRGYSIAGYNRTFAGFRRIEEVLIDPPRDPVFVSAGNSSYRFFAWFDVPLCGPGDHVVYCDNSPSPLVVFEKRWQSQPSIDDLRAWYRDRLLTEDSATESDPVPAARSEALPAAPQVVR